MKIHLTHPIARNSGASEADVVAVKTALNRLGYYLPYPEIGMNGLPDNTLFTAIGAFQKDHGLHVNNMIKPGDATAIAITHKQKTPAVNISGKPSAIVMSGQATASWKAQSAIGANFPAQGKNPVAAAGRFQLLICLILIMMQ